MVTKAASPVIISAHPKQPNGVLRFAATWLGGMALTGVALIMFYPRPSSPNVKGEMSQLATTHNCPQGFGHMFVMSKRDLFGREKPPERVWGTAQLSEAGSGWARYSVVVGGKDAGEVDATCPGPRPRAVSAPQGQELNYSN